MSRTIVHAAALLFALTTALPAAGQGRRSMTLQRAVDAGLVTAELRGLGGSSGDTIELEVSWRAGAPQRYLTLTVPVGTMLDSNHPADQDMVVRRVRGTPTGWGTIIAASEIELPPGGTATVVVEAYCAELRKDSPSPFTRFTLGGPDPRLACVLGQADDYEIGVRATQAAVWLVTDAVTHGELQQRLPVEDLDWAYARGVAERCPATPDVR